MAILNYTNVFYKFNLTDVLNVFNHLKKLTVCCCTNNKWITEVLQSRNRSLLNLTLDFTTESAKFERFKPADLLTLLNAQQRGFKLWIIVEDKPAKIKTYFSQLKRFLNKNLAQEINELNIHSFIYHHLYLLGRRESR
uniref:Uncharacterized protein n=1 Tax=Panagrellus redivivus TaxID=6233 RepID=A0A7E4W5W4_PANRE